jgi:hypothetical protein
VNVLVVALSELGLTSGVQTFYKKFMDSIAEFGHKNDSQSENQRNAAPLHSRAPLHLILQYYSAKTIPRQAEIDQCLLQNIRNKHIGTIHVLTETAFDLAYFHHVSGTINVL